MRNTKVYCAGFVFGATSVGAVWLLTYRAWDTLLTRDPRGVVVVATRVRVQPWWGVPVSLALIAAGITVSLWLLPEGRRLAQRFFARSARAFSAKPS